MTAVPPGQERARDFPAPFLPWKRPTAALVVSTWIPGAPRGDIASGPGAVDLGQDAVEAVGTVVDVVDHALEERSAGVVGA